MSSLPANDDGRPTVEVLASALRGSFPGELGIEPLEAKPELVRGRLVVDQRHLHPGGFVHGGVWVAFADSVAAWGTMLNLAAGESFTTSELKVNVFASATTGDELLATGEPLHLGKRTQVWEVRVLKGDRLAANFICTQLVLPGAADRPRP
jgi:1,4-dihydroxy-2-naphthoyl-CoA hydrolase